MQSSLSSLPPKHVILLHGLHMHAWSMRPLANSLEKLGFHANCFGYYSVIHPLSTHSKRLYDWIDRQNFAKNEPLHFVGHSLGGLVIRDFISRYGNVMGRTEGINIGRVVTIGTPHNGSLSAERLRPIVPIFLGKSYVNGLDGKMPSLSDGVELGVIAGSKPAGLGRLVLPKMPEPNDGTVLISETRLGNATDHLIMPHSHTGMPFTKAVAEQTAYFLENGVFQRA